MRSNPWVQNKGSLGINGSSYANVRWNSSIKDGRSNWKKTVEATNATTTRSVVNIWRLWLWRIAPIAKLCHCEAVTIKTTTPLTKEGHWDKLVDYYRDDAVFKLEKGFGIRIQRNMLPRCILAWNKWGAAKSRSFFGFHFTDEPQIQ